ncbi:SLC13 family permease [Aneurinibacillus aneurinilyticus]|uniref:Sodium-dependent dicarboxylate transporter SdcS n=1 Tax=Aneurinibacillus aneurinilyticus ATCC 12856 TaxID=649747 RepID=U1YKN2_ANEAE|nr:SLC13 family permease [Aneurinibacillus aneurinilyticus]ERI11326.1 cyclic nucleotide-binding domain protein [Aneurinibacillus aneurinilyticus ATCC 12856]MED0706074.1 SLC13 family permease [Aneurinibacillus aneurinilyticus]MED0723283.1 SLC13 family permease [Aneurinibacillus aneurinilyticus]MED0732649.1 SLC13 family permease [Aneurinibacillus aneurinilyticus]MED0739785.1 SLC13 family permease [Aneurinibacillus aneurinilyticus]
MAVYDIDLFQGLSNLEMAKILGKLGKINLVAGEVLFQQGDVGDSMYIIDSGKIELFSTTPDGENQSLAILEQGHTLGEMALLTGEPRSATAVAADNTELLVMDMITFQALIEENTKISTYFIRLLSQRLIQTNSRLQASKEAKSKWILQEMEHFPERLVECLLACSVLPFVSKGIIQSELGIASPELELINIPKLQGYIRVDPLNKDGFVIEPAVKSTLAELYITKYGYNKKKQWIGHAAELFMAEGKWMAAVEVYEENEEWEAAVDVLNQKLHETMGSIPREHEIYGRLDRYPDELLCNRFIVLESYLKYCIEQRREIGIAKVELALEQNPSLYTPIQLVTLYEYGAELCHNFDMRQKALEYLQMAEACMASLAQPTNESMQNGDRTYRLAKQKLDSEKSKQLAENKSVFWKRNRFSGIIAILLIIISISYFHYAPPFAGLSREGMDFIGIGIAAVVLWIVNLIPDYIVALFMAMFWVIGGLVKPEVALSGYATPTWLYMLFILAIGAAISKSGILYRLSLHALKRFPSHYRGQLWGIVVGGAVLNPLIPSSTAKTALGVPIAQTLSESMGFSARSKGAAGLGLAAMVFYGFTAPFVLTGSYTNIMAYGLIPGTKQLSWIQWFLYALPAFLVFAVGMLTFLLVLFRNTGSNKIVSQEVLDGQLQILGKLTKEERITMLTVLSCITLLILQPFHGIDSTWVMLFGFAALVLSNVLDAKTLKSGIDWPFLLFIGIAFSFAEAAKQLGIIEAMSSFLGDFMMPFMSSSTYFLLAVIFLSFMVTLIVRDDPAVILLVISMSPLAEKAGIHPWVLVFIILLSTDPFFFPYQSPTYLTAYYSVEGKSFSHRQGQLVALGYALAVILIVLLCVPYWEWLGLIN